MQNTTFITLIPYTLLSMSPTLFNIFSSHHIGIQLLHTCLQIELTSETCGLDIRVDKLTLMVEFMGQVYEPSL